MTALRLVLISEVKPVLNLRPHAFPIPVPYASRTYRSPPGSQQIMDLQVHDISIRGAHGEGSCAGSR